MHIVSIALGRHGELTFTTATGEGTTFFIRLPIHGGAVAAGVRLDPSSTPLREMVGSRQLESGRYPN